MFSAYFVFHCLNMFCFEKLVIEFLATCVSCQQATSFGYSFWRLASCEFTQKGDLARDSSVAKRPESAFCSILWETCFKPLPPSLKPLFQYFYIKTQPIWIFFHSINISKVILNSFNWFWSLDYVFESFVLLVGSFIIMVGKT